MAGKTTRKSAIALALGSLLLLGHAGAARADPPASPPRDEAAVFARVDGQVIPLDAYHAAIASEMRQKFYHGKPPEDELSRFRKEVGEKLVMQVLLSAEADRRGIEPDRAAIAGEVAGYERRYAQSEQWKRSRENILPRVVGELERRSRLARLEAQVRAVPLPDESEAREYYRSRPELFTEPERVRLSLILLRTDPGAPASVVEGAFEEAQGIRERIGKGADFAELARVHSADPSAAKGGDLGYVHRGMLPEAIERDVLDELEPGAVSKPVRVLEGVALVRLESRKVARLRGFDEVARNARELLQRERGEQAWAALNAKLRAGAVVRLDESRYGAAGPR